MNIKSAYRYQLADNVKAIIIFYIILIGIICLVSSVSMSATSEGGDVISGQFGGLELATAIFIFVAGIEGFKETFGVLMQNGVSRKSFFISHLYTSLTIAFIMAAVDKLLQICYNALSQITDLLYYSSLYQQLYVNKVGIIRGFKFHLESFLFDFLIYLSFMAAGYFIRLIYYRLNKLGAILLSVTVPVFILVVLPFFDAAVTNVRIYSFLADLAADAFGVSSHQPVNAILTCTILFLLISSLSWLLMKRATLKD